MHTAACQAKHAAHFYKGSGWPFGEVAERKWSRAVELANRLVASGVAVTHVIVECFWQLENVLQDVCARLSREPQCTVRMGPMLGAFLTLRVCAAVTGEITCAASFLDGAGARPARRPAVAAGRCQAVYV